MKMALLAFSFFNIGGYRKLFWWDWNDVFNEFRKYINIVRKRMACYSFGSPNFYTDIDLL